MAFFFTPCQIGQTTVKLQAIAKILETLAMLTVISYIFVVNRHVLIDLAMAFKVTSNNIEKIEATHAITVLRMR